VTTPPTDTKPPAPAETAQRPLRPKPTLAQRIVAFTFIGAFGLTMLTVVMTGLYVRSPSARREAPTPAVTLTVGDTRTIVTHPASSTHAKLTEEERQRVRITPGMVRISVGLEHVDDVIADVEQALARSGVGEGGGGT
jgi:hypothetical protein